MNPIIGGQLAVVFLTTFINYRTNCSTNV